MPRSDLQRCRGKWKIESSILAIQYVLFGIFKTVELKFSKVKKFKTGEYLYGVTELEVIFARLMVF